MKNKTTAALLALFLGGIGIHRFYLGKSISGIFYLLFFWTFIPAIISFIDALLLFSMSEKMFNIQYNREYASKEFETKKETASLNRLKILNELYELKQKGIITEEEFEIKKKNLI